MLFSQRLNVVNRRANAVTGLSKAVGRAISHRDRFRFEAQLSARPELQHCAIEVMETFIAPLQQ
jgi:hypothetical protein